MGDEKMGVKIYGSKHSATELTVMMKSQTYRLAVVLQPSLLCWGEDQLFVTNTNGKASEIVSVHSNWWSELPRAYLEELVVALR